MPLKNFILQEDLRAEYADRFMLYQERYHTQVLLDLKKSLEKDWSREVVASSKAHVIKPDDLELTLLQNPKTTAKLELDEKSEKLSTSRHREPVEVSPSVKVPLLYKREERDLIIKNLLKSAETAMRGITESWKEIFRVEKKGRATPWFKITHDHDEVRLQLALSSEKNEMYKTLYSVRIEYGKSGSRTRDFDRVYLISLI